MTDYEDEENVSPCDRCGNPTDDAEIIMLGGTKICEICWGDI